MMHKRFFSLLKWMPLLIFSCLTFQLNAQDNTLYFMPSIPQANQLNPAWMYPCRTYIEIPVLSSVKLNVRNTGFGFHDAVHVGTGNLSGSYFLDLNQLEQKLKRMNYFIAETDIELLGAGFAIKDWYFTFDIVNHTNFTFSYPKDIVSLRDGNWNVAAGTASPIQLSGIGINTTAWNSIGISAAHEIREGFKAGIRLSYLNGMANLNTRRSTLELNTTSNPIGLEAHARYTMNASFPVQLGYNSLGLVNSVSMNNAFSNPLGDFIFNGNRGMALDAGIIYTPDEQTSYAASITNLGFIHWKKNVNNFEASGKYSFNGINLDNYQLNPGQTDFMQALQDSLLQSFNASGSKHPYTTAIPVHVFAGAERELFPKLKVGVLTNTAIYDLHIRPSLSFSLNYTPWRFLAATLSYNVMNSKYNQLGAGLAVGGKGVQFYLLTDNIPVRFTNYAGSALMWPYNARMLSLRFGFNLLFGCHEKDKHHRPGRQSTGKLCPAYQ